MNTYRLGYHLTSVSLFLVSLVYLLNALGVESSQGNEQIGIGPGTIPAFAAAAMLVLAVLLEVQILRGKADGPEKESPGEEGTTLADEEPEEKSWLKSPLFFMAATLGYVLLVPLVGFFVTTAVFMIAGFTLLGILSWITRLAVTAGFLLFAYLLFVRVLLVTLPAGPWGF